MLHNQVTILLVPQQGGRVFRLHFSSFLGRSLTILLAVLMGSSLAILVDYTMILKRYHQQLETEKLIQLQQFKLQEISNRLWEKREALAKFAEFDSKLRLISGLQDSNPGAENSLPDNRRSDQGAGLSNSLTQLDQDIKVREISFFQLEGYLKEQQNRLARTPSIAPTEGHYSSSFGPRRDPFTANVRFHNGIDISNGPFTPIYAPADGIVINTFYNGGYGEFLVIDHGYGIITRYGHLAKYEVKVGQKVKRGQLIARMGSTGRSTANHLHYEVLVRDQHVDPEKYILDR